VLREPIRRWRRTVRDAVGVAAQRLPRELAFWLPSRRTRNERVREALGAVVVIGVTAGAPLLVAVWPGWVSLLLATAAVLLVPCAVVSLSVVPREVLQVDVPITDAGRTLGRSWVRVGARTVFVPDATWPHHETRASGVREDLEGFVVRLHESRAQLPSPRVVVQRATGLSFGGLFIGMGLAGTVYMVLQAVVPMLGGGVADLFVAVLVTVLLLGFGGMSGFILATILLVVASSVWKRVGERIAARRRRPGVFTRVELHGRVLLVGSDGGTRFHLDEPGRVVTLDRDGHRLTLRNDREAVTLKGELGTLVFLADQIERLGVEADARDAIPEALRGIRGSSAKNV
jgi:hypothetical protein